MGRVFHTQVTPSIGRREFERAAGILPLGDVVFLDVSGSGVRRCTWLLLVEAPLLHMIPIL